MMDAAVQQVPDRAAVEAAAERIAGRVRVTPTIALEPGAFGVAGALVLKLEFLQLSGSFKARGAFNKLLSAELPDAGVIAASGGNHGAAVAYAAQALGAPAEIFVPSIAAPAKLARLRAYGATVVQTGDVFEAARRACVARQQETGALMVHPYDDPAVVAGQGTTAREFAAQAPLDSLLVAVGGGGLIGGCAAWCDGGLRVVGVETEGTASMRAALDAGHPVDVSISGLAADALGATRVGDIAFAIARRRVDRVVVVDDDAVAAARRRLWDALRVAVEPAAAAPLAALLAGAYRPEAGERVGVLVCGANADPHDLGGVEAPDR